MSNLGLNLLVYGGADLGGGAPGAPPPPREKERERERERERKRERERDEDEFQYAQEGTTADPVEAVLVFFSFLHYSGVISICPCSSRFPDPLPTTLRNIVALK